MENILKICMNQTTFKYYFLIMNWPERFPVESANNIKIKIIHHTVVGDGWTHLGRKINHESFWISRSVFHHVISACDSVFKRKILEK